MAIIEVSNLTVGYDGQSILEDLTFTIRENEITFLMGGSGCGKTTLLKHMIGLYEPMHGDITIFDQSIVNASRVEKQALMHRFGVLYQSGALFGSMTLAENITLVLEEFTDFDARQRRATALEKLALVDLEKFADYYPADISGGMKKRAGLARAMALSPKLLFFDEPQAGLDPISSASLDALLKKVQRESGATFVIVSHELDSIFAIADTVFMLDRESKSIIAQGDPHHLKKDPPHRWVDQFLHRDPAR